jgi:SnoaL-like polyketide cyclase
MQMYEWKERSAPKEVSTAPGGPTIGVKMEEYNKNKEIARRYLQEVCNEGNFTVADAILAPGIVFENPPVRLEGVEAFKGLITTLRTAFPDL